MVRNMEKRRLEAVKKLPFWKRILFAESIRRRLLVRGFRDVAHLFVHARLKRFMHGTSVVEE
jgi:hypothetical protein